MTRFGEADTSQITGRLSQDQLTGKVPVRLPIVVNEGQNEYSTGHMVFDESSHPIGETTKLIIPEAMGGGSKRPPNETAVGAPVDDEIDPQVSAIVAGVERFLRGESIWVHPDTPPTEA